MFNMHALVILVSSARRFIGCMTGEEGMNGHSSECGRVNPKILLTDLYVFSSQRQIEA